MLSRLLELLRAGGTHRVSDLARKLDTTPELVEVMLEDLCRMGHLKRVGGECAGSCGVCQMAGLCAAGSPSASLGIGSAQLWALTEKGQGTTE